MDFKLSYIIGIIVVIVVIILAAAAYAGVFTKPSKITMAGSTSVQPVAQALADQYHKENPKVNITVTGNSKHRNLFIEIVERHSKCKLYWTSNNSVHYC